MKENALQDSKCLARVHFTDREPYHGASLGRIIAVANQKGRVGKTTTAVNVSASRAAADLRILLIDCDPQANATASLGFARDLHHPSLYAVIIPDSENPTSITSAITAICLEGL